MRTGPVALRIRAAALSNVEAHEALPDSTDACELYVCYAYLKKACKSPCSI